MKVTKQKKRSFAELIKENKRQILLDQALIDKIEKKVDEKYLSRAK
jgi:Fur-regulated basic protein B